jgi:hypothetical protein
MQIENRETRRGVAPRRASGLFACEANRLEDSTPPLTLQASRLLSRFKMPAQVAQLVAELAFEVGRAAR